MIIQSQIFRKFDNIGFGLSTKFAPGSMPPYYFNMSYSVGDKKEIVRRNREALLRELDLSYDSIAFQKQVHSDIVTYVNTPGNCGESDAMITDVPGLGLAVSVADCVPVFIFDRANKVIAGVHSGWRGTEMKIVEKTIHKMKNDFGSSPENLFAYIGPSISQTNYEVGSEVAERFNEKYFSKNGNGKFHLNVSGACNDMLLESGIPYGNIQLSGLCTYSMKNLLHSYRRDGVKSGRLMGVIVLLNNCNIG